MASLSFNTAHIRASFDAAAPHYHAHADVQARILARCVALASADMTKAAWVLDLGCGSFRLSEMKDAQGWNLIGADFSFGMCKEAAMRAARVVCANAEALPFASASLDVVISSLCLNWLNAPQRAFAEIKRVLKPGGAAIISVLGPGTLRELRESFAALDDRPHSYRYHEAIIWEHLAQAAGLTVRTSITENETEYYADVPSLLAQLKRLGVTYRPANRQQGMLTPRRLKALDEAYTARFKTPKGLPVSWEPIYMVLRA